MLASNLGTGRHLSSLFPHATTRVTSRLAAAIRRFNIKAFGLRQMLYMLYV